MNGRRALLKLVVLVGMVLAVAAMPVAAMPLEGSKEGNPNPGVLPPNSSPFGKSYAEWGAQFNRFVNELPATGHPLFDLTGEACATGQSGKMWSLMPAFLVTEVENSPIWTVVRDECVVPTGKAIFIPIIGSSCSTAEAVPFYGGTPEELLACARDLMNGPFQYETDMFLIVDGKPVRNLDAYAFQTPVYDLTIPDDNWLGVDCSVKDCVNAQGAASGYFAVLAPLSRGVHTIRFGGNWREPGTDAFIAGWDVTYNLTVR